MCSGTPVAPAAGAKSTASVTNPCLPVHTILSTRTSVLTSYQAPSSQLFQPSISASCPLAIGLGGLLKQHSTKQNTFQACYALNKDILTTTSHQSNSCTLISVGLIYLLAESDFQRPIACTCSYGKPFAIALVAPPIRNE